MFQRSLRTQSTTLSEIVEISEKVNVRRNAGENVLSFGTGEPDFPTPPHVIQAAYKAMQAGDTTYPPTQGKVNLRSAIAKLAKVEPDKIIISTGAKQVLANACLASLNAGDEIIIPAPYWTSYADIVRICQATLVVVSCTEANGFKLTPEQLEQAITPRTKWLLLNSPGNPSGAIYSRYEIKSLVNVLKSNPHVWIMADEIYEHISYDPFTSFAATAPELTDRTLTVNGVSKAYAMTGWRLGWGIGPLSLIKAMVVVQGLCTSGASSISQAAALAALSGPQDLLTERLESFRKRRDFVVDALNQTKLLKCSIPAGAFYVLPSCKSCLGLKTPNGLEIKTDSDFCRYILDDGGVATVPGSAFGLPGYFRLSYAYSFTDLKEGLMRIAKAVSALS